MAKSTWMDKIVEVTWYDACTSNKWRSREDYNDLAVPVIIKSVGYLFKKNKKYIAIVMSQGNNDDLSESLTIPRDWVTKIRRLT